MRKGLFPLHSCQILRDIQSVVLNSIKTEKGTLIKILEYFHCDDLNNSHSDLFVQIIDYCGLSNQEWMEDFQKYHFDLVYLERLKLLFLL